MIYCRSYEEVDAAAYRALLARDTDNLFYASLEFYDFLRRATGSQLKLIIAERAGELIGALPYAVCEVEGIGCVVNSLPWWGSHGSVVLDRNQDEADMIRVALLEKFAVLMCALAPLSTTVILLPAEETSLHIYRDILKPTVTEFRIGQMTDLPHACDDIEERLLAVYSQKTRNLVRKSLKQGFREYITDDEWAWNFLIETHTANMVALGGRAKPRDHFEVMRRTIPLPMRRLVLAMDGNTPAAAMLTTTFNGTVEYLVPAIDVRYRPRQPLSFLIYREMLSAIRSGALRWNWGGTWLGQTTLHHFKAGFGASDCRYSYLISASQEGISVFRRRSAELQALFPFFYTYPYDLLA